METVDITTDRDLEAEYHLRIPVVLNQHGDVVAEGVIGIKESVRAVLGTFR